MATPRRPLHATVNGQLVNRAVRHAIALNRYGSTLTRTVVGFLNGEVFPDLIERLRSRLEKIRMRGFDSGVETTSRYARLIEDMAAIVDNGTAESNRIVAQAARAVAKVEATWQHAAVVEAVPRVVAVRLGSGPDLRMVQAVVNRPIRGAVLSDWWDGIGQRLQQGVRTQVGIGLAQGEPVDAIVRRISGTRANNYSDGVLQVTRRQGEAIARTMVNHASTQAREETFKGMADVVKGVEWVSTLDTRTSDICKGLDGQVFDVGEGPRPPAHWNCRSTVVPVTKSLREILGSEAADEEPSTRASMDGQVAETLTYQDWLAQQPAETQNEALGIGRARLFRAGQIDVADLTKPNGRTRTLEELAGS